MIVLAVLAGCTSECAGPACEDAWPATRLFVTTADEVGSEIGLLNLKDRVDGSTIDGADWAIATHAGRLVIGMPDRSAVVVMDVPKSVQTPTDLEPVRIDRPLAERFGASVAVADTDGDGLMELWVGAPGYGGEAGAVYRFPEIEKLDPDAEEGWDVRLISTTPADGLGAGLHACTDITGDGRDDVIATAPWFTEPENIGSWQSAGEDADGSPLLKPLSGAVWLLRSENVSTVPDPTYPWELGPTWWGRQSGDLAGRSVVCDADLTGDGIADAAISAPFAGDDDEGRIYLRTAEEGFEPGPFRDIDPFTLLPSDDNAGWLGSALATRADADGIELIAGSAGWSDGRGRVSVFPTPIERFPGTTQPVAWFSGPRDEPDHFGNAVATGDFDADGFDDLLIGAPEWRERRGTGEARTRYSTGRAWIWSSEKRFRWTTAIPDDQIDEDHLVRGNQPFLRIGRRAMFVDLDDDGVDELLQPVRAPDPDGR